MSPLQLPTWITFVERQSGLRHLRFPLTADRPRGEAVLFLDGRGRIRMPGLMPYLPVTFEPSRATRFARTTEWHDAASLLVAEMRSRGVANHVFLSPDVEDVRPWAWAGFSIDVVYGYHLDFPWTARTATRSFRRMVRDAELHGVDVSRSDDATALYECLAATQRRQRYSTGLSPDVLRSALRMLEGNVLALLATGPGGVPLAAEIWLHSPGSRAYGWLAGATDAGRAVGASSLCRSAMIHAVEAAGAVGADVRGANLPFIAQHVGQLGGRLVANYGVRPYSLRTAARFAANWISSVRRS